MFLPKLIFCIGGILVLSGCGGSSGSDDNTGQPGAPTPTPTPTPAPTPAALSIASASLVEGDSGTQLMGFAVTLSDATSNDVTVDYLTSDGTAVAGLDYTATSGTLTIAAGNTSGTIEVTVLADVEIEGNESYTVTLVNPNNATVATANATGTITDDDDVVSEAGTSFLNDTGTLFCTDGVVEVACDSAAALSGQDGQSGRDVTDDDSADGVGGFVFTKLDMDGSLLADQAAEYSTTPWACVRDEVTGLVWEVKSDDGGLHDVGHTYSRLDRSGRFEHPGVEDGGRCSVAGSCDTEKYLAAVNAEQLCGSSDWRLPTRTEWIVLLNFGSPAGEPMVDSHFFPQLVGRYWTASRAPVSVGYFDIDPYTGASLESHPGESFAVKLVRGESR